MNAVSVLLLVICLVLLSGGWKRDSTDDPDGGRSGMRVYTDHATGVQYIGGMFGPVTPRLKADGSMFTAKDEPK